MAILLERSARKLDAPAADAGGLVQRASPGRIRAFLEAHGACCPVQTNSRLGLHHLHPCAGETVGTDDAAVVSFDRGDLLRPRRTVAEVAEDVLRIDILGIGTGTLHQSPTFLRVIALNERPSILNFLSKFVPTNSPSPADAGGSYSHRSNIEALRSMCSSYQCQRSM